MRSKIKTRRLLEQLSSLMPVNKITSVHGYFNITGESSQKKIANIFSNWRLNNHEKNII